MARAQLIIDLDAVAANWSALDAMSAANVETAAVVKADAYGLGAPQVARRLQAAGARSFFVAIAEEGAALRESLGPQPDIYVFSGLMQGDVEIFARYQLIPCLNSPAQLSDFEKFLPGARLAIQINSGMNRLGMEAHEAQRHAENISRLRPGLVISHLACSDDPTHPQNADQARRFLEVTATMPGVRRGLAATFGTLMGHEHHHHMTRPGIGLYGGAEFPGTRSVVRLSLPVLQVRDVDPGHSVGYGAAWRAQRPTRVATVQSGYADGIIRAIGGQGVNLYADGVACPIIGRVSMDLLTVDVTDLATIPPQLELLNERQGVKALAEAAGTISYEILTALGHRYERVYKGGPPAQETA